MDGFWIWMLILGLGVFGGVFAWLIFMSGDSGIDDEDIAKYA